MVDTLDPRLAQARERTQRTQQRHEKAKLREAKIADAVAFEKRKAELTQAVSKAVKDALTALKLDVPAEGITLFVHKGEGDNSISVDVKIGKRTGSDGRKTITTLGHSGFILPDGSKVGSAAKVLDHFGHPHHVGGKGKGDAAHREILRWIRDNPDKAQGVKVVIGKEKVPLSEAVSRV